MRAFLVIGLVIGFPGLAQATPPKRTLVVHGEGRVRVKPDAVRISVGLETQEPTLKDARSKNGRLMRRLFQRVKRLRIPKVLIKSDRVKVTLIRESRYPRNRLAKIIGYRIYNSITIRVNHKNPIKLARWASRVLDAAVASGANHINGTSFLRLDARWAHKKAMLKAIQDAKVNAQRMAQQAGVTLGKVMSVQPRWGSYYPQLTRSWGGGYYGHRRHAYTQASRLGGSSSDLAVAAGIFIARSSVSVTYELR